MSLKAPQKYLKNHPTLGMGEGNNGFFVVPSKNGLIRFMVICSDNYYGWEHVSVSIPGHKRTPTWEEMCYIKDLFWEKEDCVIQYHPPESEYVNNHAYVLHLWRNINLQIPTPPSILVGFKGVQGLGD